MQSSHSLRVNATPLRLFCRVNKISLMIVTIQAAETQLSRLIEAALAGEEVVIVRGNKPLVRLSPLASPGFRIGILAADVPAGGPDFFSPLEPDERAAWEDG